jgi:hypothetical protein
MKKAILIILLVVVDLSASELGITYLSIGGGYPVGLLNSLNSGLEKTYGQTDAIYGNTSDEKLTKTYAAGSFSCNLGIGNKEISTMSDNAWKWFMMCGYSFHGTGESKWSETYNNGTNNYDLSVSAKYKMHDIRLLPVAWWTYGYDSDPRAFGIGAGGQYSFVKYIQSQKNEIPNNPWKMPDNVSLTSSGITWIVYGFLQFGQYCGIEVSTSGTNLFYVGIFLGGVTFSELK